MIVKEISFLNFRNLLGEKITSPGRLTVFEGDNGQGKTNIVEGIYLLTQPRSFRQSRLLDFVPWAYRNSSASVLTSVAATVVSGELERSIELRIEDSRRFLMVNGNPVSQAGSFLGQLTAVEFTPSSLEIVRGQPLTRRQFIDRIISQVDRGYFESLVRFHRSLSSANSIFSDVAKRKRVRREAEAELSPWLKIMSAEAVVLVKKRQEFIACLQGILSELQDHFSGDSRRETATLRYSSDFVKDGATLSVNEVASVFAVALEKGFVSGWSHVGIQRDDLEISLTIEGEVGAHLARLTASQGQARSIALGLKLAAAEFMKNSSGTSPIILLDDVDSELDYKRRRSLCEYLMGKDYQVFITTTSGAWVKEHKTDDMKFYRVERGRVFVQ
ncbi:MAG: DNA replication and repair protein RecF [bacterium]|nr:DNA replication and repair protein RecF [bacterium]